jgi:hypothetical protein
MPQASARRGPTKRPPTPPKSGAAGNLDDQGLALDNECEAERSGSSATAPFQATQGDTQSEGDGDQPGDRQPDKRRPALNKQAFGQAKAGQGPAAAAAPRASTVQQFTDRALASLQRLADAPAAGGLRAALLSDVKSLLSAAGTAGLPGGGLEAVRNSLVEATRQMQNRPGMSSAALQDLQCLLPLMLLNLQRGRTSRQARQTQAVLHVLTHRR